MGALNALFAKLAEIYGDDIYTKLETRWVDGKEVLQAFSIVMPYAREVCRWGTRALSVDATFAKDDDHRIKGACWTIVHKPLPGLQATLASASAMEASLPLVLQFEIANESTETTNKAFDALVQVRQRLLELLLAVQYSVHSLGGMFRSA